MKMRRREALGVLTFAAGSALLPESLSATADRTPAPGQVPAAAPLPQERVTGIGGLFFRARDPKAQARWYQEHLGIIVIPQSADDSAWNQQAGPTAFAPMPEATNYFGDASKQWMVNFRVADLDRMAKQLEAAGIAVKIDPTMYPNGRFARIHDPEGNPIELWQPMKAAART